MTQQSEVKHILFIGLSCVGDVVMTTPVLRALHDRYPGAKVDIVADRRSAELLEHCQWRGKLFYKDKQLFLRGAPALWRELVRRKYDVIVDLRTDGLTALLRGRKKYTKSRAKNYGPHATESFMGTIREIHGDREIPPTSLWLTAEHEQQAQQCLEKTGARSIIALAPGCGGKREEKFWPTDHYAELVNGMQDLFDFVLLLGTEQDRILTGAIAEKTRLPLLNLAGRTGLLEAAALLQKSSFFVGSDSGLGHVAGAMGTPTLTLFSVDRPDRCLPRGPAAHWLWGENQDARNISVADVANTLRKAMQAR